MSFWPYDISVLAKPPLWKGLTLACAVRGFGRPIVVAAEPLELTGCVDEVPSCRGRRRNAGAVFFPEAESLRAKDAVKGLSLAGFDIAAAGVT